MEGCSGMKAHEGAWSAMVDSGTAREGFSERRGARVMMRGGKGAHEMQPGGVTIRVGGKSGERGGSGDGIHGWGLGSRIIWGTHIADSRLSRVWSRIGWAGRRNQSKQNGENESGENPRRNATKAGALGAGFQPSNIPTFHHRSTIEEQHSTDEDVKPAAREQEGANPPPPRHLHAHALRPPSPDLLPLTYDVVHQIHPPDPIHPSDRTSSSHLKNLMKSKIITSATKHNI